MAAWRRRNSAIAGVQPLFEGSEFSINANETGDGMELWTANSDHQADHEGHRGVVRFSPSFRGDAKHRTRNHPQYDIEIPGLVLRTIPE